MNVRRAVIFAILMENRGGVLDASPQYVMEKLRLAAEVERPEGLLDRANQVKFRAYCERWGLAEEG